MIQLYNLNQKFYFISLLCFMSIVIRDTAAALGLEGAAQRRPIPCGSVSYLLTLQKKKKCEGPGSNPGGCKK